LDMLVLVIFFRRQLEQRYENLVENKQK